MVFEQRLLGRCVSHIMRMADRIPLKYKIVNCLHLGVLLTYDQMCDQRGPRCARPNRRTTSLGATEVYDRWGVGAIQSCNKPRNEASERKWQISQGAEALKLHFHRCGSSSVSSTPL
jgi:hypothetical protein